MRIINIVCIQVCKSKFDGSIHWQTQAAGWFSLLLILNAVGQGVSLGLHTRILTEKTNGCKYGDTEGQLFTHVNAETLYS